MLISRINQTFASFQSRMTLWAEIAKTTEVSATLNPAKNRNSTTPAFRGSICVRDGERFVDGDQLAVPSGRDVRNLVEIDRPGVIRPPHPAPQLPAIRARGEEAGLSRMGVGIHYRSDHEAGMALGKAVANKLIEIAEQDGSVPR